MSVLPLAVYALCALASIVCAVLLVRGYLASRARLLLWSSICFMGLAVNSLLLFVDLVVVPEVDLSLARAAAAAIGICVLVFGLVWDGA